MKPAWLAHDVRDDRREVHRLIEILTPRERIRFLRDCCSRAAIPNSTRRPSVQRKTVQLAKLAYRDDSANERLSVEVFLDCMSLACQYQLDLDAALDRLVEMVRKRL
jgi:hypothetical protein